MVLKNYVAHCLITVLRKQLALEHFYIYWCIVHALVMVKGCFLCKNDLILLIYMYKYYLLLIHDGMLMHMKQTSCFVEVDFDIFI